MTSLVAFWDCRISSSKLISLMISELHSHLTLLDVIYYLVAYLDLATWCRVYWNATDFNCFNCAIFQMTAMRDWWCRKELQIYYALFISRIIYTMTSLWTHVDSVLDSKLWSCKWFGGNLRKTVSYIWTVNVIEVWCKEDSQQREFLK